MAQGSSGAISDSLPEPWLHIRAQNCEDAWGHVLATILEQGADIPAANPYRELEGMAVEVTNPRDRIVANAARRLNVITAVARFVWMMAASNRLEDIRWYEPRVSAYSDDGLTVPGSDYGARALQPRPGLNQLTGVISRLRSDSYSRRAAMVIWQPEDAVRTSSDVPCAFGVFFRIRSGKLIATTVMRSNNAFTLLPVNLFEFGLLGEIVATELEIDDLVQRHVAMSMHVYGRDRQRVDQVLSARGSRGVCAMPAMPAQSLDQVSQLARLEAELRHNLVLIRDAEWSKLEALGTDHLVSYWLSFYRVLLVHALWTVGRRDDASSMCELLPPYFREDVQAELVRRSNGA